MGKVHTSKQHVKTSHRKAPKSENTYLKSLVELYSYLARRTDAEFNKKVRRALNFSKINRPPVSVGKISQALKKEENAGKIVVVVGTVTDDITLLEFPQATIAALRVTATARAKILKAGGEILTLDQLALKAPQGENTLLLAGSRTAREACRHFGFGPHQKKAPRILSTGRKFEKARGRRQSRAFKV
ncbi:60S ribosomal protein L18-B [Komagataella phaffii CBS 7435]|uniref:Protein component of the large (60S) ribosomal subunit n=2 Tax=Komagataella phaffii TaxID=460519 RepID=C4QY71_KOMPG|nr:60S ribosomal protein L18 [Komagataella phaffii GS115]KAI0464439.1 60S ribosomal protein L18A [Komagataella kurtzmanii]CAH2447015.1 60S ribosomal protein L18 [Komagataella phaffii CBS 7435]CAY68194.1 Protein component of the large (60S) ribosomal subunit [Komagataella phaffii GS115]SCV11899.1 60S ribosomal protein L18-B [Komagataella phaffii CBS 7435]